MFRELIIGMTLTSFILYQGCTSSETFLREDLKSDSEINQCVITGVETVTGEKFEFDLLLGRTKLEADTIKGWVGPNWMVQVPTSQVKTVYVKRTDAGKTIGLVLGLAVIGAILVALLLPIHINYRGGKIF